ncbi:MAG: MATE family efflux transporter, partial [Muribaculaceae bacterium]|nr:MATE family efflux transporter [Muribaculaceae bacterium]
PIIGYNYGARHFDRLRAGYKLSMVTCMSICLLGSAVGVVFPEAIARMFTSDFYLIHVASRGIRIALLMFWSAGFQIASTNMFQSIGKAGKSIFLSLTRQVIFFIPIILILPDFIGLEGVWFTFTISDFLAAMATLFLVIWQFRQIRRWETDKVIRN